MFYDVSLSFTWQCVWRSCAAAHSSISGIKLRKGGEAACFPTGTDCLLILCCGSPDEILPLYKIEWDSRQRETTLKPPLDSNTRLIALRPLRRGLMQHRGYLLSSSSAGNKHSLLLPWGTVPLQTDSLRTVPLFWVGFIPQPCSDVHACNKPSPHMLIQRGKLVTIYLPINLHNPNSNP